VCFLFVLFNLSLSAEGQETTSLFNNLRDAASAFLAIAIVPPAFLGRPGSALTGHPEASYFP
jgi:hypothetical protein